MSKAPVCYTLLAGLLCVPALAARGDDAPAAGAKLDPAKLVGEWTYVSGKNNGADVEKDRLTGKVKFTKDTITLASGMGQDFVIGYKVDASKSPATIDMDIKDGPIKEGKAEGIIELKGDDLKFCYAPTFAGGKRPTKFESTADSQAFYFVLKRAK